MTTPPLVLLDLDGTLTDSVPGTLDSVTRTYRSLGIPVPDAATLRTFVGPPITQSFCTHGVRPGLLGEAVATYRDHFVASGMWNNSLYTGALAQLELLRADGHVLAVATSKPEVFEAPQV